MSCLLQKKVLLLDMIQHHVIYPIGSMYAIYGNMDPINIPQMLAYIPYMDPMGYIISAPTIYSISLVVSPWSHWRNHLDFGGDLSRARDPRLGRNGCVLGLPGNAWDIIWQCVKTLYPW